MWLQSSDGKIRAGVSEMASPIGFATLAISWGFLVFLQLTSQAPLDLTELIHPVVVSGFQDSKGQSYTICEDLGFRIHTAFFLPVRTGKATEKARETGGKVDSTS